MTYYLLPRTNIFLFKNIKYQSIDLSNCPIVISNSLSNYLYQIKENIDNREEQWDIFKKYTNPFEYIHSVIPYRKKTVAMHKPLSRSYFKMIEICNLFNLVPSSSKTKEIKTFHLAEGPGGFIEAIANLRLSKEDKYYGITLLDNKDDTNIPSWKKSANFLKEFENVILENGIDGTGNILKIENFEYISEKYKSSMDIITADGGFDFSIDFNQQEIMIGKLLFAQIAFTLCLQKKGGSFILKIFDCFMQHTVDLLELLSSFYEKVYIVKPQTSRYANSEKYIVCIGFIHTTCDDFYPYLDKCFRDMSDNDNTCLRFLESQTNYAFIKKLEEYNAIFGQKQIQNIQYTLSLMENKIKHDKIENLIKTNIKKSTEWCIKYSIPYNTINSNNIFINYND